ncbi:hypothetical protein OAI71_01555 [Marine Group III euryarchaeote]|nr:hypothetical protein [Marine Group III euryarchaeote]
MDKSSKDYSHLEAKALYDNETVLESLLERLSVVVKKNKEGTSSGVREHWTSEQDEEWEIQWNNIQASKSKINVIYNPDGTLYNPHITYSNKSNYRSDFWERIYLIDVGIDFAHLLVNINRAAADGSLAKGGKYTLKFIEHSFISLPKILGEGVKTLSKGVEHSRDIIEGSLALGKVAGNSVEAAANLVGPAVEIAASSAEALEFVFEATPHAIDLTLKSAEAAITILEAAPQAIETIAAAGEVALSLGEVAFSILDALS